jgi:ABC-type uncharacterized transport system permease subunit
MILLYLLVFSAYLAAAYYEWRALDSNSASGTRDRVRGLLPLVLACHAYLIFRAIVSPEGLDLSLANALSAVAALAASFAWLGLLSGKLTGVAVMILPAAACAVVLPALFPNPHRYSFGEEPWAAFHIAIALSAYALLILAALQASVLMGLERRLHKGVSAGMGNSGPPLLTLERFLFRLVACGYALLTLTLLSGILFSEELFGKPLTFSHKVVFSVLAWLVYGALLVGRYRYGWRGRKALGWVLTGTAFLVLAYIGSKFVVEVVLGR